jgi:hypothetical protein
LETCGQWLVAAAVMLDCFHSIVLAMRLEGVVTIPPLELWQGPTAIPFMVLFATVYLLS